MAEVDGLLVQIEASTARLRSELSRAERSVGQAASAIEQQAGRAERAIDAMGTGLAGIMAGVSTTALLTALYSVNAEFGNLKAGLEGAMGSAKAADAAMAGIREFAKETPYGLAEVTTAFIRLKNLGLDPSNEALTAYGDIAASVPNKTIMDFIEAAADAAVGEYERLKEFSVKASSEGDKVRFTFKGVTTEVKKSAADIQRYLINLGKANFGGSMARQMEKLGGAASQLKDNLDGLFVRIGEMGAEQAMLTVLQGLASSTEVVTDNLDGVVQVGGAAASAVGGLVVARTAAAAMVSFQTASAGAVAGLTMMSQFGTAATARMLAYSAATGTATAATRGLTAVMGFFGGPVGLGLSAAAAAAYLLATNQTLAEKAADQHRRAINDLNTVVDVGTGKLKDMTAEVRALRQAQLEAARDASKAAIAQQESFARAGNFRIDRFAFEATGDRNDPAFAGARELQQAFLDGKLSAADLYTEMTKLADQDERLKPLAQSMTEWAEPLITAKTNLEEINAALAVLNGTATDAQREQLGLGKPKEAEPAKPEADKTKKFDSVVADLKAERAELSMTSKERFISNQLRKLDADATDAQKQAVRELAAAYYEEQGAIEARKLAAERLAEVAAEDDEARAKARENAKGIIEDKRELTRALDDELVVAQKALEMSALTERARRIETRLLQEEIAWREKGIPLTEKELEQKRAVIAAIVDTEMATEGNAAAMQYLEQFGSRAFDRIGSAITEMAMQGKADFADLKNVGLAIVSELMQEFILLAAINPLKNAIFGGNAQTLTSLGSSLFSGFAEGGRVAGPGSGTSDSIPAMLSNGEYVVNARATSQHLPLLEAINGGRVPRFADGGLVMPAPVMPSVPRLMPAGGGGGGDTFQISIPVDARNSTLSEGQIRSVVQTAVGQAVGAIRQMQNSRGSPRV